MVKMIIEAKDLKKGQIIRVEYGDYDNWQNFCVSEVSQENDRIKVKAQYAANPKLDTQFSFADDEMVEVVD